MMTNSIIVTQLDAVHRQLSTAIDLWLEDGDPVSIHTLAAAAYQIVNDLNRKQNGPPLLQDTDLVPKEKKAEFISIVKSDSNYFKHADDRGKKRKSPASITFYPEVNEIYFTYTIQGLKYLKQNLSRQAVTFMTWQSFQRTDLLNESWRNAIHQTVDTENIDFFRALHKKEFFKRIALVLGKA